MGNLCAHITAIAAIGLLCGMSDAPAWGKGLKQCRADYEVHKAALWKAKQGRAAFFARCKAGVEVVPPPVTPAPMPDPTPEVHAPPHANPPCCKR